MNRKERRASRADGAKPARGSATSAPGSESVAGLFGAAVAQHQAGALAEAERRYRYLLSLYPDHSDSLHNLGLLALHGGNASSAVELIGKAITLNERVAEYHYNIALAWRALSRMDLVAAHLQRAIELRSDHVLAHLNLGNVHREQGRLAEAAACYERVIALNPNSAAARFNLANVLSDQRRWDAAVACYRQALALEPNHAEAHCRLGAALMAQGNTSDAIPHLETAVIQQPDIPGGYENLSTAYVSAGKLDLAVHAIARRLELRETPEARVLFGQSLRFVRFSADDKRLRILVFRALTEAWARPRELTNVCISLIKVDAAITGCIARATSAWPTRLGAAELFGSSGLAALSADEFLIHLLKNDPITDIGLEYVLTNARQILLTLATGTRQTIDEQHLKFYAALAQQCFINEYVYALPETEEEDARALRSKLAQLIQDGAAIPALWLIAAGAYFPLYTLPGANALLDRPWPDYVKSLLIQQVEEPAQERRIAAAMPALTRIDGEVSRAVRQQYEENPYPRWVKAGPAADTAIFKDLPPHRIPDVLIAGCGTGLSTVEFAGQTRDVRILAIDLSLASLSYGKRIADSFGLTNIEFAHADIMMLGSIGRQFDCIDASGVLHHMADPWAGWRVLLSLLRPGGTMRVGLYSELARPNVVAARALIAERGYGPTVEDIRRCREDIIASDDPLLKSLTMWGDFFTVGECRDMLFHVQEHRITLPEIKSFLAANGVRFAGFLPEPALVQRFQARFPERSAWLDLDCWHRFETEAPDTFVAMYQFWVHKPA
jgi:tetratricopeptide (TPR) repeat protein/SAM-dependent methyltransferase